jgi:hypothetical protein
LEELSRVNVRSLIGLQRIEIGSSRETLQKAALKSLIKPGMHRLDLILNVLRVLLLRVGIGLQELHQSRDIDYLLLL